MMYIYKFIVEAERVDHHTGNTVHDTSEHYIAAYSYDHAHSHVWGMLERAGWKINKITGKEIFLNDIRDKCDHITD